MSELIVMGFDDEFRADEVLLDLTRRQDGYRINQEDAAVVVRKADGDLLIRHSHSLITAMSAHGSFWGMLIGALLLNPLAGVLIGGAVGAVTGSLRGIGIEDAFVKAVGATLRPGTSVLFVMEHEATPASVLQELEKYEGKLLQTTFDFESEEQLRSALNAKKH